METRGCTRDGQNAGVLGKCERGRSRACGDLKGSHGDLKLSTRTSERYSASSLAALFPSGAELSVCVHYRIGRGLRG